MTIALCAGGTGGHIYPALAVAQGLPPTKVFFVGSRERLEAELVQAAGLEFKGFSIPRGQPWRWPQAVVSLLELFRVRKISVLVCFGGYVCLPAIMAARLLDIPFLLHEQNKIMGRLNRLMAPWAAGVALSFVQTAHAERMDYTRVVGCPVRREFLMAAKDAYRILLPSNRSSLVVLGGSQGAQFLNDWVLHLVKNPPVVQAQVFLITGAQMWQNFLLSVSATDQKAQTWVGGSNGLRVVAQPYVHNMPALLSQCQAFVGRAGASTLAEMAAMGLPGVVVPYPFAMDDHQSANARAYHEAGAVQVVSQDGLSAQALWQAVESVWLNESNRQKMAAAMGRMALVKAANDLVDWVRRLR